MATPTPATPSQGPACAACGERARVHWQRRLTDTELADYQAAEQSRRDERLQLADPQLPAPVFPPLPTSADCTRIVPACGPHAISMDAAAHIHGKDCTAPNPDHLPDCDCDPEPLPEPAPAEQQTGPELPDHWATP